MLSQSRRVNEGSPAPEYPDGHSRVIYHLFSF